MQQQGVTSSARARVDAGEASSLQLCISQVGRLTTRRPKAVQAGQPQNGACAAAGERTCASLSSSSFLSCCQQPCKASADSTVVADQAWQEQALPPAVLPHRSSTGWLHDTEPPDRSPAPVPVPEGPASAAPRAAAAAPVADAAAEASAGATRSRSFCATSHPSC